jgi:uncharacterized protein
MNSFSDSAFGRFLRRLALAVCRQPGWFVCPQICLSILCLVYTVHWLRLDRHREDLIGRNLKSQVVHRAFEKEFPGVGNELVVVVESGQEERNRQFIQRLAAKVKPETNLFSDLFYKADLTTLGSKGLLLASADQLEQMHRRLQQYRPWLAQFSAATNLDSLFGLINAQFRHASRARGQNFLEALPFLQGILSQARQDALIQGRPPPETEVLLAGGPQAEQHIYVTANEGQIYLLTTRPKEPGLETSAIKRLRQLLEMTQEEVPGVNVGLTGGPVLDDDEIRQARRDTTVASIVAFVVCAVLFIGAYRQVWRPLKAALCLLLGMAYALAFATLAIGHLNILSITFAPMLIGLAIDFGVHFISRYEEEMRNRRTVDAAIERATTFTGLGIVTGAVTTAAAFLAMALTRFRGIREVGFICGCGLLLCLVPMLTTLPALLRHGRQNLLDHEIGPGGQRRLQIELTWLRHPVVAIVATVLLCAGAALQFHRVHFDYDLLHMQNQSLAAVVYEKKLINSAGLSSLFGVVIADSAEQARQYEARLKRLPSASEVRSAADFMDSDETRKLELVRAIQKELAGLRLAPVDRGDIKLESLSATLWYLSGYLGLAAEAAQARAPAAAQRLASLKDEVAKFRVVMLEPNPEVAQRLTEFQQGLFGNLHGTIRTLQTQDTRGPMGPQDLPQALRDRFIGVTGKYLVQVYPRHDLWQHANQKEFKEELESVVPSDRITGEPIQLYEYTTLLKKSYEYAAGYALFAIIAVLLFHFRSLGWTLLALLPVAVGSIWLLGFMGLTGLSFNPANIMILPLVLGIGVTNGIQILNRFAEERQPSIFAKSTGKAVLVSGLTAIAGFGSLMLAGHPGIRSLGIVMSVGIAACMAAALAILPALLRILTHQERRFGHLEESLAKPVTP